MSSILKQRLEQGQIVLMVNPNHLSVTLVEKLIRSGADSVFLDCEHGMHGFEHVQLLTKAANLGGGFGIVRPQNQERSTITRCLNAGADGIMVPLVNNAETAREIVRIFRYACPENHADKLLICMIETTEAVDNLDEILAVEGIDVFFVGPGDLSQSMGYSPSIPPGGTRPQAVIELVDQTLSRIRQAGKLAGTLAVKQDIEHLVAAGAQLIYYHADPFVTDGVKAMRNLATPK